MSKLGRYSADRKKVETLTAAKVVEVAECGTLFMCDFGGAVNLDLPDPAAAGKGWWCKFIVADATLGGAATIRVLDAAGSAQANKIAAVSLCATDAADDANDDADTVTIASAAVRGTQVEFVCDGSHYYAVANSAAHAHIAIAAD